MNESFKTDPSLATSARAAKESGSYLCASNVTPTAVRFIVSVFLCLLCSCRMSSTQMTCSHFRKNRPKKRLKPAGCRSCIISKNRPVPIFGRSTGASLLFSPFARGPLKVWGPVWTHKLHHPKDGPGSHRFVIRKSSEAHLYVDELYQLLQNLLFSDIAVQHICNIIDFWLEGPWRWVQMAYEILNEISQWGLGIVSFRFIRACIILKRENIRLTPQYIHKNSVKKEPHGLTWKDA